MYPGVSLVRTTHILNLLLFALVSTLWAASGYQDFRFTNINRNQGLSNGEVTAILRDSRGLMWFGTRIGLNRWDGRAMRTYHHNPEDSMSITNSRISTLAETPDGKIWIGTHNGGLTRMDPELDHYEHFRYNPEDSTSLVDDEITALQVDSNGRLWVGTKTGLCRLDSAYTSFKRFHHDPGNNKSIPSNYILAMEVDRQGTMWFGTGSSHIFYHSPEADDFTSIKYYWFKPSKFGTNWISDLHADPDGENIWVGMFPIGTFKYSKLTGKVTSYRARTDDPHMVHKNIIFAVDVDANGQVWLGHLFGISILEPESGQYEYLEPEVANPNSINISVVTEIHIDDQGMVWIGSSDQGVDVCNPQQLRFDLMSTSQSMEGQLLPANPVFGMDKDSSGNMWIATNGGGVMGVNFETGESRIIRTEVTDPAIWSMNYSNKILVDRDQRVWMGSFGAGIFRLDQNMDKMDHYRKTRVYGSQLNDNDIFALYQTRDGSVWVGTEGGGINHYLPESDDFEYFKHDPENPESLGSDNIRVFLEDHRGDFWIATSESGVDLMDRATNTFKHFIANPDSNSISSNHVLTIYEDKNSILWFGTRAGSLCRLDSTRTWFEVIDLDCDIEELEISGILEDDQGHLWLSSNVGILKYHPEKGLLGTYQASDGVQNQDFFYHSSFKDQDGTMYFGGVGGLNRFHPDSIGVNDHIPPVILTDLWVNHEQITPGKAVDDQIILHRAIGYLDTLRLSYKDKVLRFDFAALDYWNPFLNQYCYKLENFDPDWVSIGNDNSVTYTSLDPGWYTLRVRGSNNDRVWNEQGVTLAIYIKPPFWQTAAFRMILSLGLITLIIIYIRLRTWRLRFQNQKLEALVRQRSAELAEEIEARAKATQDHLRRELLSKTLHLNEKDQIVDHLKQDLEEITQTLPVESKSRMKKLLRFLKDQTSGQQGWEDFELWFTEVHTEFYSSLRETSTGLSESELKVCALLRLNLVTKDIARVMNIQSTSIDIYRHRIRKKLNLSSDENLTAFLSQF